MAVVVSVTQVVSQFNQLFLGQFRVIVDSEILRGIADPISVLHFLGNQQKLVLLCGIIPNIILLLDNPVSVIIYELGIRNHSSGRGIFWMPCLTYPELVCDGLFDNEVDKFGLFAFVFLSELDEQLLDLDLPDPVKHAITDSISIHDDDFGSCVLILSKLSGCELD